MKRCPNSNIEYEGDKCRCPQCLALEKDEHKDLKEDWVTVTTVSNDIEYELVAGLLNMGNIPAIRKVEGVDGYLQIVLGIPIAGIHVLVPKDKYDEALQLINSEISDEELEEEEEGK